MSHFNYGFSCFPVKKNNFCHLMYYTFVGKKSQEIFLGGEMIFLDTEGLLQYNSTVKEIKIPKVVREDGRARKRKSQVF